jgi:membrane dipeptidase
VVVTPPPANLILDGHVDLAWNALENDRDLELAALTIRTHEHSLSGPGRAQGMLSWPDMAAAGVAVAIATLRAPVAAPAVPHRSFASDTQAHAIAHGHLAYYLALDRAGRVRILPDGAALLRHWSQWQVAARGGAVPPPPGLVLALAGADPVLEPSELPAWWADGVRVLAPAHPGDGRYAGGYGTHAGLAPEGRELLAEAAELGMVLDLADASDATFDEALDGWRGPVLVSHGACRARTPALGNIDDARIDRLAGAGGVLGITLQAAHLVPHRHAGRATLEHLVDHVEHVCSVAGGARSVGLGSDLDDPLGRDGAPEGIETIGDLPRVAEALTRRRFSDEDVAAVLGGNLLTLLERGIGRTR